MEQSKTEYIDEIMNIKKQRNILVIILMLIITASIIFFKHYQGVNNELTVSQQNIKALNDSIRVSKNKNNELTYSKNVYVSNNKKLKDINEDLHNILDEQEGKISELNEIVADIENNPVYVETEVIKYVDKDTISGQKYGLKWDYDTTYNKNNSRELSGLTEFKLTKKGDIKPIGTRITKDYIKFGLITGLREKDDNIEIFVTSKYPNMVITGIEGAIINPNKHPVVKKLTKQNRFSMGPQVGVGLNLSKYFGTGEGFEMGYGFQVGWGVQYTIISF